MDELSATGFVAVARAVGAVASAHGLLVPSFRCPPRTPGVDRAITRWAGSARVSVRRAGVATPTVVESMVEGVVAANRLGGAAARALRPRLRAAAWTALDRPEPAVARPTSPADAAPFAA
ncbi:MAG: hypothetical protein ABIS47_11455 [Acidimicrobiales bacterium]